MKYLPSTIGTYVSWLTLIMVITMTLNVLSRYLFGIATAWQQELVGFMHALVFMLASGYTLSADKHVRVDIFYQKSSARTKALINMLGAIFLLIPTSIAIAWYSNHFILSSWQIFEHSAEYQGIYGIFLLKTSIWIFSLTLIIQAIITIQQITNQQSPTA